MKDESRNSEQLRRMLALKRHEQPPPGYFHNFSSQVIFRIQQGERGELPQSWAQRLWALLESKPAFAGAFGVAVCAVLVSGILNSEEAGLASSPDLATTMVASPFTSETDTSLHPSSVILAQGSEVTNEGASTLSALFENYPTAQPVGFQLLEPESMIVR